MAKKYSFMYNTRYDDGAIVLGQHLYGLPANCTDFLTYTNPNDWTNLGLVSIHGNVVTIEKYVVTNFDFYGGGFQFKFYSLVDEQGESIDVDEHSTFIEWLKKISI
jgi:hypothetical protein